MIEAMRAALDRSLAWDVEGDVRAGELTREEQCKVVAAQIAALEAMGAVVVPREPTEGMVGAGCWHLADNQNAKGTMQELMAQTYRAMIAAAPMQGEP
jgi:hypothetical protein